MKFKDTTSQPAALFQKEIRRILFTDISDEDFPELLYALDNLFVPPWRRKCILWVAFGGVDIMLKNEEDLYKFVTGVYGGLLLADPSLPEKRFRFSCHSENKLQHLGNDSDFKPTHPNC